MRLLIILSALIFLTAASNEDFEYYNADKEKWDEVKEPTKKEAKIYGGYVSGCLEGAEALPFSGEGFLMVRGERGRYFAHPSMINFIKEYGKKVYNEDKRVLFVSDISQARGGPAPPGSAHNSHQTGLDVDFWYQHTDKRIRHASSLLTKNKKTIDNRRWDESIAELLEQAASFDDVERIFVNAHIKKKLCENHSKEKWLSKVRPWWGHHDHFHIRLKCPEGDETCISQHAVGNDTACDDSLEWWFSEEAAEKAREAARKPKPKPTLPTQCKMVLNENDNMAAK